MRFRRPGGDPKPATNPASKPDLTLCSDPSDPGVRTKRPRSQNKGSEQRVRTKGQNKGSEQRVRTKGQNKGSEQRVRTKGQNKGSEQRVRTKGQNKGSEQRGFSRRG